MKRFNQISGLQVIVATLLLLAFALCGALSAKQIKADPWKTKENMTLRLAGEWPRIILLQRESSAIKDVLASIRDIELYPQELTGFNDKNLVEFDKKMETLDKRAEAIDKQINSFIAPLRDAIAILRELVVGDPVESMFETLEKGNLFRITGMLAVNHSIDTLWRLTDQMLDTAMKKLNMPVEAKNEADSIDDEFFTILKANMGMRKDEYYPRLNAIREHLFSKALPWQIDEMVRIERHHIDRCLEKGEFILAERRISDMINMFPLTIDISDYYLLLAQTRFQRGAYREAILALNKIKPLNRTGRLATLYRMQSLYVLNEYDSILADTLLPGILELKGADLNLSLWILLESALALSKPELVDRFAKFTEYGHPYSLHIAHALARSLRARNNDSAALAVLKQTKLIKPLSEDDHRALQEINVTIARIYYEKGEYDTALSLFYEQIKEEATFEQALFGIAWCYIKSDRFDKAETALKKLINQSPENSWGTEGILTLARRYLELAAFAWKKYTFVSAEKERLLSMVNRIDSLESFAASDNKQLTVARDGLSKLLVRINEERLSDYKTIANYYQVIDRLCKFIISHYHTGSFQESSFSANRTRLLSIIDSIQIEMSMNGPAHIGTAIFSNAREERSRIRKVVNKSRVLSAIAFIDRYRWEIEYLHREKDRAQKKTTNLSTNSNNGGSVDSLSIWTSRLIDSLVLREDSINAYYSTLLRSMIPSLLSTEIDSNDACYFHYQLGEVLYRTENSDYAHLYEQYEIKFSAYANELEEYRKKERVDIPVQPAAPRLSHRESMDAYRDAILASPLSPFSAAAHYGLAWCFNDIGMPDSAYRHMRIVAGDFPDNPYAAQALMFCGEYHFEKGNLDEALTDFYNVMKYPESEWFDEALYKVAWTQYRLSNPEKAISSFLALVDLGSNNPGSSLLEKESMDYIAISFSEADVSGERGLDKALAFAKKIGDMDRGCLILHRLAHVYREQGRHDMAKKTFQTILKAFPSYSRNHIIEAELLATLERDETAEKSTAMKYRYYKKYNSSSPWAASQPDSVRRLADSTASRMLYDAAISYHQLALQKSIDTLYSHALKTYTDFITSYPHSPLANECHYNLAEIQFSLGNYLKSAEEYIAVSRRYPDSKYKETAAWNAIVASQNLLKAEQQQVQ